MKSLDALHLAIASCEDFSIGTLDHQLYQNARKLDIETILLDALKIRKKWTFVGSIWPCGGGCYADRDKRNGTIKAISLAVEILKNYEQRTYRNN